MTMVSNSEQITRVHGHILREAHLEGWQERHHLFPSYRHLVANQQWREGWISFDAVTYCPLDGCIYCGLNDMTGDLLYRFTPETESFSSLNSQRWADRFDVKIHRTLLYNPADSCFYFATSMLHDVEQQAEARGGKLVRYDPVADEYELLGIPAEKLYIQSIAADFARGKIYGFTYPAEGLFEFDIGSRQCELLAWTGNACLFSQPHNGVVDNKGWFWGTCAETRAWDDAAGPFPIRLFKYHPDGRRFVWFDHGLPRIDDPGQLLPDPPKPQAARERDETRHREDYGFVDSMCYDGNQFIYVGTTAGVLARIDTSNGTVAKLAHVIATGRLPALTIASDGTLYGGGGLKGHTQIFRYRPGQPSIDSFYHLYDTALNDSPVRIHEMAVAPDHTLYLGENDNHGRSSFLWSCRLDRPGT